MRRYTIVEFRGGGAADGERHLVDGDKAPSGHTVKGYADLWVVSIYVYHEDEQNGNVTVRVYRHCGDITFSQMTEEYVRGLSRDDSQAKERAR